MDITERVMSEFGFLLRLNERDKALCAHYHGLKDIAEWDSKVAQWLEKLKETQDFYEASKAVGLYPLIDGNLLGSTHEDKWHISWADYNQLLMREFAYILEHDDCGQEGSAMITALALLSINPDLPKVPDLISEDWEFNL